MSAPPVKPAILFAQAADVFTSVDGEVFIRLWQGGSVIAVAGFKVDGAEAFERELQRGCRTARLKGVSTEVVH